MSEHLSSEKPLKDFHELPGGYLCFVPGCPGTHPGKYGVCKSSEVKPVSDSPSPEAIATRPSRSNYTLDAMGDLGFYRDLVTWQGGELESQARRVAELERFRDEVRLANMSGVNQLTDAMTEIFEHQLSKAQASPPPNPYLFNPQGALPLVHGVTYFACEHYGMEAMRTVTCELCAKDVCPGTQFSIVGRAAVEPTDS